MPFRYTFFDQNDPQKKPKYVLVSQTELSRVEQERVLNDYIEKHRYQHDFSSGTVEIPYPPDISDQPE
jgi:hypothetical protein